MKIDIAYFTSTGNTLWLAQRARDLMGAEGHAVRLFDPVAQPGGFANDADLLGILYPVWASTLPDPLQALVQALPRGEGRRLFLLGNCAIFTGDTGMHWKRRIEPRGYDVFFVDHLLMPINVNVPGFNFWPVPPPEEVRAILGRADEKLAEVCAAILSGERRVDGTDLASPHLGSEAPRSAPSTGRPLCGSAPTPWPPIAARAVASACVCVP